MNEAWDQQQRDTQEISVSEDKKLFRRIRQDRFPLLIRQNVGDMEIEETWKYAEHQKTKERVLAREFGCNLPPEMCVNWNNGDTFLQTM